MQTSFFERVDKRETVVGVVGLGYVGLPLVMTFARKGFRIVGFDVDENKVDMLLRGASYIRHIPAATMGELCGSGAFAPTTDFAHVPECDALLLCVPTPLGRNREPDMSYVRGTAKSIAPHLRKGQLVVLESTTYPGTTDELLRDELEHGSGLTAGRDFMLAYSPEREDPGNESFGTANIPKVVGGLTPNCREAACALYGAAIAKVVPTSSTRVAELTKLLENIFRSVNIALVNELKTVCHQMDIDIWEVIDKASTKPFGYMPFYPGPGLGGHCIPIDPFYLTWKAREYGLSTRFIELAGEINTAMPKYVVERIAEALNQRKKALNGASALILGLAYKKDVDDARESPSLELIELLRDRGAEVQYHDPFIPVARVTRRHDVRLESMPLTDELLKGSDVVLIATAHTCIDYQRVVDLAPLVVDARNATAHVLGGRDHIVKA